MDGGGKRGLRPRIRDHRALRELDGEHSPRIKHEPPTKIENGWKIDPPLSSRLWQKSAVGKTASDGSIILQPIEVMFCHWHRHLPLPTESFVKDSLTNDPDFLQSSAALSWIRERGDILTLSQLNKKTGSNYCWGFRWDRNQHPSTSKAKAQVRWARSSEQVVWHELFEWVKICKDNEQDAEFLVVDDEFDVTYYKLNLVNISGDIPPPNSLSEEVWSFVSKAVTSCKNRTNGIFLAMPWDEWPLKSIGTPQMSGVFLDELECEWVKFKDKKMSGIVSLLDKLLSNGTLPKPGFKYGCRWRVYKSPIGEEHAPWLISPLNEAPTDWNSACLTARLAAGVNKHWICAIPQNGDWSFMSLERTLL